MTAFWTFGAGFETSTVQLNLDSELYDSFLENFKKQTM